MEVRTVPDQEVLQERFAALLSQIGLCMDDIGRCLRAVLTLQGTRDTEDWNSVHDVLGWNLSSADIQKFCEQLLEVPAKENVVVPYNPRDRRPSIPVEPWNII
jgi:hypothetical protein